MVRRARLDVLGLGMALALALGCARTTVAGTPHPGARHRGVAVFGFEAMAFVPCGQARQSPWWLEGVGVDGAAPLRDVLAEQPCKDDFCGQSAYVEMDGVVSGPGRYGHLDQYTHEIRIERVYYAARERPASCR